MENQERRIELQAKRDIDERFLSHREEQELLRLQADEIECLREHIEEIDEIATDPAFASDAMAWINGVCSASRTYQCPQCDGRGWLGNIDYKCRLCSGNGRLPKDTPQKGDPHVG